MASAAASRADPSAGSAHLVEHLCPGLDDGDDLGVRDEDDEDGDDVLDDHETDGVDQVGRVQRPLLHADVVEEEIGAGEVEVVGASVEDSGEDGQDGDGPDESDHQANGGDLVKEREKVKVCSKRGLTLHLSSPEDDCIQCTYTHHSDADARDTRESIWA